MPAAKHNYKIEAGATFRRQITYKDANGIAIDLTGYTAAMQIRQNISDAAPSVDLTTQNGGIAITGASGILDIYISSAVTSTLSFTTGVYDIEITDTAGSGDVTRLIEGRVTIDPNVTR